MATPPFVLALRERVGTEPLWLSGATAVILRETADDPHVLLVRRSDTGQWTPVSGIVDPGEDPHVTVEREAMEEASVRIEVERLIWLHTTEMVVYPNGDQTQYLDHCFRCRWVSGDPKPGDDEATDAAFFVVTKLPPMSVRHRQMIELAVENPPETQLGPRASATGPEGDG